MSNIALSSFNSPGCQRCESLPAPLGGPGTLHLRPPIGHSLGKIIQLARESGWEYSRNDEILSIVIAQAEASPVIEAMCRNLTTTEQHDTRILFQRAGELLQWQNFFEVESLKSFLAKSQSGWLIAMLKEQRLTTWFQPIIHCAQPDEIFAYECLMRGKENDDLVFPDRLLDAARGGGLLFQLDRMARVTAIKNAARFGLDTKVFINFTPTSIYDPKNCLQTTMKAVDESHLRREQIVFEVIECDEVTDPSFLRDILDFYRGEGFGVALDDIGSGYSSLNLLSRIRPDYIKLDRELVAGVANDSYKGLITAKLLEIARELEVRTVAEGVETLDDFQWLRDQGADYAQGYLFARPATPPPEPQTLATLVARS